MTGASACELRVNRLHLQHVAKFFFNCDRGTPAALGPTTSIMMMESREQCPSATKDRPSDIIDRSLEVFPRCFCMKRYFEQILYFNNCYFLESDSIFTMYQKKNNSTSLNFKKNTLVKNVKDHSLKKITQYTVPVVHKLLYTLPLGVLGLPLVVNVVYVLCDENKIYFCFQS